MVRSTGSAGGTGDDAILKSSQKAPLEKHFEEARGKSIRGTGNSHGSSGNLTSLFNTHMPPEVERGEWDGDYPEGGLPRRGGNKLATSSGSLSWASERWKPRSPSGHGHTGLRCPLSWVWVPGVLNHWARAPEAALCSSLMSTHHSPNCSPAPALPHPLPA